MLSEQMVNLVRYMINVCIKCIYSCKIWLSEDNADMYRVAQLK